MKKLEKQRILLYAIVCFVALFFFISISVDEGIQNYEERTKEAGIQNNLRTIASSADQHFLTTESEKIEVNEMITLGYFDSLENFDGEDYSTILVEKGFERISVSTRDGTIYTYGAN
ncbi:MAG: hypothetical protein AAF065_14650 [Verrucomicrobiota bacterium]